MLFSLCPVIGVRAMEEDDEFTSTVLYEDTTGIEIKTDSEDNSKRIVLMSDIADTFPTSRITSGGKFRLTCTAGNIQFVLRDTSWSWNAVDKTLDSDGTIEFTYDEVQAAWGSGDFSNLQEIDVKNQADPGSGPITVTKLEWLEKVPTHTVSFTTTGDDTGKYEGEGFRKDALLNEEKSGIGAATLTVKDGTMLTIAGLVWKNDEGGGDFLQSVTIDGETQDITAGQDYPVAITKDTTISASYKWFATPPSGGENSLKTTVLLNEPVMIAAGEVGDVLTLSDAADVFKASMILPEGKFRIATTGGAGVHLVLKDNWTEITGTEVTKDGTAYLEFDYDTCLSVWKSTNSGAEDFSNLAYIQIKNTSGADVTVDKVEWLGPKDISDVSGGEDPDPGPGPGPGPEPPSLDVDANGVVSIPNDQGNGMDFTGKITPGGYFRVEYTLKNGASDGGIQLAMEPHWVSVSEPSKDKEGNLRKGSGGGVFFAEFTYADCEKAWNASENAGKALDKMAKVFPQYEWNGPGGDKFEAAIATYSVKYYPTDDKSSHPLGDGLAEVGTSISTSLSGNSYQWYRVVGNATANGVAIPGAGGASYTPTESDRGFWLYCVVDGGVTAGPAAVVASRSKTTVGMFCGSKELAAGDSTDLWSPASDSRFNKVMLVPGGEFRMTFAALPADTVKLVLKEPWTEVTGRVDGSSLVFDYEAITSVWKGNFAVIGEIDVKNTGGTPVTVTGLEWTGYDTGVTEAPYQPTDRLPFGGSNWALDWQEGTVVQSEEKNLITADVQYTRGEWSTARIQTHTDTGFIVDDSDMISLNVYLEKAAVDAGGSDMQLSVIGCTEDYFHLNTSGEIVTMAGKEYYRTALNIPAVFPVRFNDFILAVLARNSSFSGTILVENLTLRKSREQESTILGEPVSSSGGTVLVSDVPDISAYYGDIVRVAFQMEAGQQTDGLKLEATLVNDKGRSFKIRASNFKEKQTQSAGGPLLQAELEVPCTVGKISSISVCVIGYSGDMKLCELTLLAKKEKNSTRLNEGPFLQRLMDRLPYTWDFSHSLQGWHYEPGWNSNYSGANTDVRARDGRMAVTVNYNKDQSWSQMAVSLWHDKGMTLKNANHVSLYLYYQPERLDGSLTIKLNSGGAGVDTEGVIQWDKGEEVRLEGTIYRKVPVDFNFAPIKSERVHDLTLCLVGRNTSYRGMLLIEKITIEEAFAGSLVRSGKLAKAGNSTLRLHGGTLITASGETVSLPEQVTLVDGEATAAVRSLYAYLKAVGSSKDVLFGQQYNFGQKAGSPDLSDSDTYDLVKDYAAVYGLDALALTGSEFSASRCNQLYGTPFPSTAEGNVVAASYLTNTAIKRGAIITLSCHMPNFSQVKTVAPDCAASYARYDFSGYTPNVLTGDTANQILPGGKYHEMFNAYLDMIADYANRVNGAVLFRPFHENTGSWFWWGAEHCSPETYRNIYRYTVEYLRDVKKVHNFLYVYGPGSEASTMEEYAGRYPGDGFVDMVGFDMYDRAPDVNGSWMAGFQQELALVSGFAAEHGKLVAVTETGAANDTAEGDRQTALLRSGNKDKDWFRRVLDVVSDSPASYFLVWANFSQTNGFYTPYVIRNVRNGRYGHEMMDNFIDFYDDPRSVFAGDQKDILTRLPVPAAGAAGGARAGFQDVPAGAWYRNAVDYVSQRGLMYGVNSSSFAPCGPVTRAMAVQVLYRLAGEPAVSGQSPFQDVADGAWYARAVTWAASNGIVNGHSGASFLPDEKITRAQLAAMLYRYARSAGLDVSAKADLSVFNDVDQVGAWALEAMRWANQEKLIKGTSSKALSPGGNAVRAQLAAVLMRFCSKFSK